MGRRRKRIASSEEALEIAVWIEKGISAQDSYSPFAERLRKIIWALDSDQPDVHLVHIPQLQEMVDRLPSALWRQCMSAQRTRQHRKRVAKAQIFLSQHTKNRLKDYADLHGASSLEAALNELLDMQEALREAATNHRKAFGSGLKIKISKKGKITITQEE